MQSTESHNPQDPKRHLIPRYSTETSCELFFGFFTSLYAEMSLYFTIMHHWLVHTLNKYGMRLHEHLRTKPSILQLMSPNPTHSKAYAKIVAKVRQINELFKVFRIQKFQFLFSCAVNSLFIEQRFDIMDPWPLVRSVSGVMQHSSLCLPTESGLHLICLLKKVSKVGRNTHVLICFLSINSGIAIVINVDCHI